MFNSQNQNKYIVDMDFILAREKITFDIGSDGLPYGIFSDNCWSFDYCDLTKGAGIAHWNNYENAVQLQTTIGL